MITIALFSISILSSCGILYILGYLWFTDARNRQVKSLFVLGLVVAWWLTMNGISMVALPRFQPFTYTLSMVAVCAFPFATLWFALHYTGSRLVQSRALLVTVMVLSGLDVLGLVTNPLHRLFYVEYGYPLGQFGPLFWVHSVLSYVALVGSFLAIVRYTVRHVRQRPVLLVMVFLLIVPCIVNILFNLGIWNLPHDITPIGFFGTFLLFALSAYRSRLLSFRTTALASVFDTIDDCILIVKSNGEIIDANQSFRTVFDGFSLAANKTWESDFLAFLKLRAGAEGEGALDAVLSRRRDSGEFTCRVGGEEKTFTVTRRAIEKGKKLDGYILALADVSEYHTMIREINQQNKRLVELREVAESASQAKGNFLSSMSHEMRTPMNAIIGMAEIARQSDDMGRIRYCISKIGEASQHLLGLINDVLDMAKIEAGKLELDYRDFPLRKALDQVVSVIDFNVRKKNQTLTVEVDDSESLWIHSDQQRLAQVITNLLSNATKFTPEGGEIGLSCRLAGRDGDIATLEFQVRDNGIGISPEQQKRLFTPFGQADSGISRKYGGTGLGLAISKNIVDQMGGRFRLESQPGQGSTFSFTILTRIVQGEEERPSAPVPAEPEDYRENRILLAEDIAINQEILIALLEPTGIRVDCASDGDEAVRMFREFPDYDLIFMDIQMPGKDGYEATQEIRAWDDARAKAVPIVAMTANVFREEIEKCLAVGMNGHIGKPVNVEDVHEALRRYIKGKDQTGGSGMPSE